MSEKSKKAVWDGEIVGRALADSLRKLDPRLSARKLLRTGSRIAGRLASDWYAVYVETPGEGPGG